MSLTGVYAPFSEAFAKITRGLKIGPGLDETSDVGPLTNRRGLTHAQALVEDAKHGARVLAGGGRPAGFPRGYFFEPSSSRRACRL